MALSVINDLHLPHYVMKEQKNDKVQTLGVSLQEKKIFIFGETQFSMPSNASIPETSR